MMGSEFGPLAQAWLTQMSRSKLVEGTLHSLRLQHGDMKKSGE